MYASILLINYMYNCTIVTTASQRQRIIKLTLVVIELFCPWQDHWPPQAGCTSMRSHASAGGWVDLPPLAHGAFLVQPLCWEARMDRVTLDLLGRTEGANGRASHVLCVCVYGQLTQRLCFTDGIKSQNDLSWTLITFFTDSPDTFLFVSVLGVCPGPVFCLCAEHWSIVAQGSCRT